ncbi:MAG: 4-hydroxy-tetrahydrodipicolinate reductase [Saprospiraceae bacterium]|nr:MAG: 4-hydroxy-tetrahydrodipicolinate reductase [Saprospiraceae bacterium]
MKIALIGYGKMGKAIETIALEQDHEIVLKIDSSNREALTPGNLKKADVAIEFSRPETAFDNIRLCLENGTPVVVGTTGWMDQWVEAKELCNQHNGALFVASNFSVGVNIFFALNSYLARLMKSQKQYEIKIEEIHHTQKLDAPSGTAITLAEGILSEIPRKKSWILEDEAEETAISIRSQRIGKVPGTHKIHYLSSLDSLSIQHEAHSREGFAKGAIQAASWIIGREGVFGMSDMLGV